MQNGETIPIKKTIREGETPAQAGVIGRVEATDKDSDHKNNEIFYKIVGMRNNFENPDMWKGSSFKAWSRLEYCHLCFRISSLYFLLTWFIFSESYH